MTTKKSPLSKLVILLVMLLFLLTAIVANPRVIVPNQRAAADQEYDYFYPSISLTKSSGPPGTQLSVSGTVGNGNNNIQSGAGSNGVKVTAGNGNNGITLQGSGNDVVVVGNGNNNVQAGSGNNIITVGNGNNNVNGGVGGTNTCYYGTGNDHIVNCKYLYKT